MNHCSYGCINLRKMLKFQNSVRFINYAFGDCDSLAKFIPILTNVESILYFLYNTRITTITGSCSETIKSEYISNKILKFQK